MTDLIFLGLELIRPEDREISGHDASDDNGEQSRTGKDGRQRLHTAGKPGKAETREAYDCAEPQHRIKRAFDAQPARGTPRRSGHALPKGRRCWPNIGHARNIALARQEMPAGVVAQSGAVWPPLAGSSSPPAAPPARARPIAQHDPRWRTRQ